MVEPNLHGDHPRIDKTAVIHPSAVVIGRVRIGKGVFVCPHAVIRADEPGSSVNIGDGCNVQDGVILHALAGSAVRVARGSSLSHGCIVHGPCVIGAGCFVGFGAVVFRSSLSGGVFVGHRAVVENARVPAGMCVPAGSVVDGPAAAKALKRVSAEQREFIKRVAAVNAHMAVAAFSR